MLSFKNREQGERDKNQIKCKKKEDEVGKGFAIL